MCIDYTIRKAILFGNLETGVRGIVTYMLRGKSFGTKTCITGENFDEKIICRP